MKLVKHNFLGLICLGALIFLLTNSYSYAQNASSDTKEDYFWVNMGGGFASVSGGLGEDEGGISGGIGFSYCRGSSLFSIRGIINEEFKLDLWGYSGPPDRVWDIGALYGRAAKVSWGVASISAGIGLVGMSHNEISSYRLGITLENQIFWTPISTMGIGIYGFANLNSEKSFVGALVCLQIGRLRRE